MLQWNSVLWGRLLCVYSRGVKWSWSILKPGELVIVYPGCDVRLFALEKTLHVGGCFYRRAVLSRSASAAAKSKGESVEKAYGAVPSEIVVKAHKRFQKGDVRPLEKKYARECMEVIWESCRGSNKRPLP